MIDISIIVPVYKSKAIIPTFVERVLRNISEITPNFEIIFIDDGCPENSWESIQIVTTALNNVKGIQLSRNFGQNAAISAGLKMAKGKWVVVMDCDLQDRPEEISKMYNKALEGFEIVVGKIKRKRVNIYRKFESYFFYGIFNYLTGIKANSNVGNFGIYHSKVIKAYLKLEEDNKSFGAIILWSGFKRTEIEIDNDFRFSGKSSYTLYKKLRLAFNTIISFSDRFLIFVLAIGLISTISAMLFIGYFLWQLWHFGRPLSGWTSTILSIYFSMGVIVSVIGLVGLYIGKIFNQVKQRPQYIISNQLNVDNNENTNNEN